MAFLSTLAFERHVGRRGRTFAVVVVVVTGWKKYVAHHDVFCYKRPRPVFVLFLVSLCVYGFGRFFWRFGSDVESRNERMNAVAALGEQKWPIKPRSGCKQDRKMFLSPPLAAQEATVGHRRSILAESSNGLTARA